MKTIAIELAREAGLGFFRTCDSNETSVDALERFAELIVRECIQFRTELSQFDNTTAFGDGYENGLKDMAEAIAEHFGVK